MPTLLAINNYYYYRGGAETVFLEHNRMFEELQWQVIPFAMRHAKNLDTPWSRHFVDEIELGEDYTLTGKLTRAAKVIYSFEARKKLAGLLDTISPDICHAHNIYHHISPSILSLLHSRGIPTVMTLHDLKIACPEYHMLAADGICERCKGGRLHNVLLNRCIKRSTSLSAVVMLESMLHRLLGSYRKHVSRFVVPSQFYINKFCEWGFPPEQFHHVPNFVAPERYVPRFSPGRAFVSFGRISPEKGLATLVRAAAMVGCSLRLVGTGPQLEELRNLAAQLAADVTFVGYLTGEALHDEVRRARAVVLPSEWYENASMSLLEAYALGKPVIGARIGGIPEQILNGQTGLTFTSGDAVSLAAALRTMQDLTDAEVEQFGRAARQRVEQEYSLTLYRNRMVDIYLGFGVETRVDSLASTVT